MRKKTNDERLIKFGGPINESFYSAVWTEQTQADGLLD